MLSHVEEKNRPGQVDISESALSLRMAMAVSVVVFPPELRIHVRDGEIFLGQGPVFQTAIIAATMAVKKTHEMIPFCHQIPIESCQIEASLNHSSDPASGADLRATITCRVITNSQTGVETEALHGAMTAALVVYDMCKALSNQIVIGETRLVAKTGGKSTFLDRPIYGLVLTGGKSERMQKDKALIAYRGLPHAQFLWSTLKECSREVYLSARKDQWAGTALSDMPVIYDTVENQGPMGGLTAAFAKHPDAYWFVVACDLVHFNRRVIDQILAHYDPKAIATCFRNREQDFPEALCALYSPLAKEVFEVALGQNQKSPVTILLNSNCRILLPNDEIDLANINTTQEYAELSAENRHEDSQRGP